MSSPAALSPPPASSPPWTDLPLDLTANILQRLGAEEILQSAQFVCATWWKVCQNPALWRIIKIVNRNKSEEDKSLWLAKLTMLCRRAVDLSQGQLIDLTIAYFGDKALLRYIVDRSSNLQRLTLAYCEHASAKSLVEAVKKLKELEEFHLNFEPIIIADMEAVGNACPMLKSFTFNYRRHKGYGFSYDGNEQARAISKSMPNLHHLVLLASDINNEGLQAILDGCPRLESLDLRECTRVDLTGPLGERCFKQIKHIKLPSDSLADYEWDLPTVPEDVLEFQRIYISYATRRPSLDHQNV